MANPLLIIEKNYNAFLMYYIDSQIQVDNILLRKVLLIQKIYGLKGYCLIIINFF